MSELSAPLSAEHFVSSPSQLTFALSKPFMSYGQVSLSDLSLKDMCLIIRFYRTMQEVMVVIVMHLLEVLEDMERHLLEGLEVLADMEHRLLVGLERKPLLDMEEEE